MGFVISLKKYIPVDGITEVDIPNNVTSIEEMAFAGCNELTSIKIPSSVESIGDGAFSDCSSLQSITLPFVGDRAGVTSSDTCQYPFGYIFSYAYRQTDGTIKQYDKITGATTSSDYYYYYIPSTLKSVTVLGGYIPYGAFMNCYMITSVTLGENVTSIGSQAFNGCSIKNVYATSVESWCKINFYDVQSNPLCCSASLYINGELQEELEIR